MDRWMNSPLNMMIFHVAGGSLFWYCLSICFAESVLERPNIIFFDFNYIAFLVLAAYLASWSKTDWSCVGDGWLNHLKTLEKYRAIVFNVLKSHLGLWGHGYARLQVHEFLLAVDDDPEKFELLMRLCRQKEMLQEMRSAACCERP